MTDLACQLTDLKALELYFLLIGIKHHNLKSNAGNARIYEEIASVTKHDYESIEIDLAFSILNKCKKKISNASFHGSKADAKAEKK
jgi:hypothetical protein